MTLTILTVNTTADQNDGSSSNGLSLRDAILIANANPNTGYEIHLTGGVTYTLTSNGINEDAARTGDLDIKTRNNVLYIGAFDGQKATIDASGLLNSDRVFHVLSIGRLSLQNVVVTGGLSTSEGGGIKVESTGFLDLYNVTVRNNQGRSGGGIYNLGITYLSHGSSVINNSVSGAGPSGGGIRNVGTLTAIDSTISNNDGGAFGGGIYNAGTQTLINTTVSGNTARTGGGIANNYSSALSALLNTTVSSNSASLGGAGGIDNDDGIINILNSTVTNNTFSGILSYSGGITNSGSGTVNLRNTIVAGNFDLDNRLDNFYPDLRGTFNGNNNLIGNLNGASGTIGTGTDIVNANPRLGPLQNNGGLTLTHALLAGSPAINAGNNSIIPTDSEDIDGDGNTTEQIPYDQRGLSRVSGTTVDIGAFEVQTPTALPTISLRVTPASVTEDGATNLVYSFTRTGGNLATPLNNVSFRVNGTAGFNSDYTQTGAASYTATTGTVNFAANSATATVTIDPTADTLVEANETAILTLNNGTGYSLGTPNTATGTITNDDVVGTNVTLGVNYSAISENSPNNVIYTFTRTGLLNNPLTVNYTVGGTATRGNDYAQIANSVTFAANSATATIIVNPTEDTIVEPNETVILTLSNGTGYSIGTTNPVTTTILNDDGTRRQVGTSGNDNLVGTNKGDILIGGLGNDLITGGGSNDLFTFGALNEGIDTITDFTVGDDFIVVRGSTFGGGLISGDSIKPNQLIIGTVATNPNNRFIYNSGTGALSFDRDGNGTATPTQFATLNRNLALTFEDIFVS